MENQYIIGVDGGGTKTRMVLGDTNGNILADIERAGTNHQHVGEKRCKAELNAGFLKLLALTGLEQSVIAAVYLGLSGADIKSDFDLYNHVSEQVFGNISFEVGNDVWLVMRAGLETPIGSVVICGTGSNAASINKDGKAAVLRQLEYELGAFGGSMDIAREAFHRAFRSNEQTGRKSALETEIPLQLNLSTIEECIPLFYPTKTITISQIGEVTKLVFDLADYGDQVCHDILVAHGQVLAENLLGTLRQVEALDDEMPIVLGGTLLTFDETPLMSSFKNSIKISAPHAYFVKGTKPPVMGAYLKALDMLDIPQTSEITDKLNSYFHS